MTIITKEEVKYYWICYNYLDELWDICTTTHPFVYVHNSEFKLINWKRITAEDYIEYENIHS